MEEKMIDIIKDLHPCQAKRLLITISKLDLDSHPLDVETLYFLVFDEEPPF